MTCDDTGQQPMTRLSVTLRWTNKLFHYFAISALLLSCIINIPVCDARWMDSSVSYTFRGSKSEAYGLYSSLDLHPTWSPWLEKVDYDRKTGLSVWTLSYLGLRYSWRAQNTIEDPPNTIQWEALDGLPNRGKVEFVSSMEAEEGNSSNCSFEKTTINLTVSYELPEAAALVLKALGSIAKGFINNTLLGDLKRFHKRVEEHRKVKDKEAAAAERENQKTDHNIIPPDL